MIFIASLAFAADSLVPGEIVVDPPTLLTLGVQWQIEGDDDYDASVAVRYREGSGAWHEAAPLFRVHPEDVTGQTIPEQFAGSIFDLRPDTTYTLELTATDPDGGSATETVQATTRGLPHDPANPRVIDVSTARQLTDAMRTAQPGDVITLAAGTYEGNFVIESSGTEADPIVIRGEDGVILDGDGYDGNLIEVYGSYVHIEQLTLQNSARALRFQGLGARDNVVRYVTVRDCGLGFAAKEDQQGFYICDNDLQGPLQWPHIYTDNDGDDANVDGILIMGDGHVVCHNRLIGWGDSIKIGQEGARGIDFYGNEVESAYDNALELDNSEGNVRAFWNRFLNGYAPISFQPVHGGPVYVLRNVVVNVAHEQLKFHSVGGNDETSGIFVVHNTFVSAGPALTLEDDTTSHHFVIQNNLFVGSADADTAATWSGGIEDGQFRSNGWFPDGRFDFGDAGAFPDFAAMTDDFDPLATLIDEPIFTVDLDLASYREVVADPDVTPHPGGNALGNAEASALGEGGHFGDTPTLGAIDPDCPPPDYGPRAHGFDETTLEACGEPTDTDVTDTDVSDTDAPDTDIGDDTEISDGSTSGCGCKGSDGFAPGVAIALLIAAQTRRRRGSAG